MASAPYTPTSLATSKYAPAASRLTAYKEPLEANLSHALVTKEKLNASNMVDLTAYENGGMRLVSAQDEKFNSMITEHNTKLDKSLSTSVANMRALIESLRDTIKRTSGSDRKGVETTNRLGEELEHLFLLATDIKQTIPKFLEQQKQNYALYHHSALQSSVQQSYTEISVQKEKIELQDNLIRNQQKWFLQFQADTKAQLDQLADFQERVSRLTLDHGLLKNERNKSKGDSEKMMVSATGGEMACEDLQTQIRNLVATTKDLKVENQTLRNTLYESQLKALDTVKQSSDVEDQVASETVTIQESLQKGIKLCQATQAAEALPVEWKLRDNANKTGTARLTNFNKAQLQKDNEQSTEFRILTHNLGLAKKENSKLKAECEQMGTEKARLKVEQSTLRANEERLQSQLEKLRTEYEDLKTKSKGLSEDTNKIIALQNDKKSLQSTLEKLQKENEELELENNELIAQNVSLKDTQASNATLDESLRKIDKLQATIDELATSNKDLGAKLQDLEVKKTQLDQEFERWQALAKEATKRYKDQVANTKEMEKDAEDQRAKMAEKITQLEAELRNIRNKENISNGSSRHETVIYWKGRYESLLNKVSGISTETN